MTIQVFRPAVSHRTTRRLSDARERVRLMDAHDHTPPHQCPLDAHLRTVLQALLCGLDHEDFDVIAEGVAMLQDAEARARGQ